MKQLLLLALFVPFGSSAYSQHAVLDSLVRTYPVIFSGIVTEAFQFGIHDLGTYPVYLKIKVDSIYRTNWVIPEELEITVNFSNLSTNTFDPDSLESYFDPYRSPTFFFLPNHVFPDRLVYRDEFSMQTASDIDQSQLRKRTNRYRMDLSRISFYPKDSTPTKLCQCVAKEDWNGAEREIGRYLRKSRKGKGHNMNWFEEKPCVAYVYKYEICLTSLPSWCGFGVAFQTPSGIHEKYLSMKYGKINRILGFYVGSRVDYQKFLGMSDDPDGWKSRAEVTRTNWLNTVSNYTIEDTANGAFIPGIQYFHHAHLEGPYYAYLNKGYFQDKWMDQIKELETKGLVYHLCLLSLHADRSVQMAALESLRRLNDPRAIPYLIEWAEYQASLYLPSATENSSHQAYCIELVRTLNALTGLRLLPENGITSQYQYGQRLIKRGLPSWRSRIVNAEIELPD